MLGPVVVDAALGLIHFDVAKRIRMASRRNFYVFVATAIGLFFVGVVAGIIFGVVLSMLLLIQGASRTPLRRMAYDAEQQVYVEADTHPDATTPEGVLVVEINGPLFFADAATVRTGIHNLVSAHDATVVVVDLEATPAIDLDGADMLTEMHRQLAEAGVRLLLTHADVAELEMLRRAGTLVAIGEDNVYETVRAAVASLKPTPPQLPHPQ